MKRKQNPASAAPVLKSSRKKHQVPDSEDEKSREDPTVSATKSVSCPLFKKPSIPTPLRVGDVSAQLKNRPRMLAGLESQNVLAADKISVDLLSCDEEAEAIKPTQRATRSRGQYSPKVHNNSKYHPMDDITRPRRASKVKQLSPVEESSDTEEDEETLVDLTDSSGSNVTHVSPRAETGFTSARPMRSTANPRVLYDGTIHPQDNDLRLSGVAVPRKRKLKKAVDALATPQKSRKMACQSVVTSRKRGPSARGSKQVEDDRNVIEDSEEEQDGPIEIDSDANSYAEATDCPDRAARDLRQRIEDITRKTPTNSTTLTKQQHMKRSKNFYIHVDKEELSPTAMRKQSLLAKVHDKNTQDLAKENFQGPLRRRSRGLRPLSENSGVVDGNTGNYDDMMATFGDNEFMSENNMSYEAGPDNDEDGTMMPGATIAEEPDGPPRNQMPQSGPDHDFSDTVVDVDVDDDYGKAESVSSGGKTEIFERNLYLAMDDLSETWSGYGADEVPVRHSDDCQEGTRFRSTISDSRSPSALEAAVRNEAELNATMTELLAGIDNNEHEEPYHGVLTTGTVSEKPVEESTETGNAETMNVQAVDTETVPTGADHTEVVNTGTVDTEVAHTDTANSETVSTNIGIAKTLIAVALSTEIIETETINTEAVNTETVSTETFNNGTFNNEIINTETFDAEAVDVEAVNAGTINSETVVAILKPLPIAGAEVQTMSQIGDLQTLDESGAHIQFRNFDCNTTSQGRDRIERDVDFEEDIAQNETFATPPEASPALSAAPGDAVIPESDNSSEGEADTGGDRELNADLEFAKAAKDEQPVYTEQSEHDRECAFDSVNGHTEFPTNSPMVGVWDLPNLTASSRPLQSNPPPPPLSQATEPTEESSSGLFVDGHRLDDHHAASQYDINCSLQPTLLLPQPLASRLVNTEALDNWSEETQRFQHEKESHQNAHDAGNDKIAEDNIQASQMRHNQLHQKGELPSIEHEEPLEADDSSGTSESDSSQISQILPRTFQYPSQAATMETRQDSEPGVVDESLAIEPSQFNDYSMADDYDSDE